MSQGQDPSSEYADSFGIRKILELLLGNCWIPIVTTILGIGAGFAYLKLTDSTYEAKASVEVLMTNRNVAGLEVQAMNMGSAEAMVTTEANLQRTSLFQKVMEREDVSSHPGLGLPADMSSLDRALEMEDWTRVRLRRGSGLIDITVEHGNPEIARLLATGIFEEYVKERVLIESGSSRSAFEMLLVEKREIDGRLQQLEADQQAIEKVLKSSAAIQDLEREIEVLMQTKGPLHPEVKVQSMLVATMYKELEAFLGKVRHLFAKGKRGDDPPATAAAPESTDNERLMEEADRMELIQLSLLRDIESERVLGEVIVGRLKEAEITIDIQTIPLALVEPAFAADEPVSPQPVKILAVAMVFGGGIGLALIAILYFLDSTCTTVSEAETATGLPVVGAIPYHKRLRKFDSLMRSGKPSRSSAAAKSIVLLSEPGSPRAEAFRTLRATLRLHPGEEDAKSYLLVSALPDDGKSFVAANLACALAATAGQAGRRTLLIDADLRRPSMQAVFGLDSGGPGLSEALNSGWDNVQSLVVSSAQDNLDILPAGGGVANPAELLSSPDLPGLLEELAKKYDRIVIDVAPVNSVADGLLLAPLVDSLLLVAQAGQTPRNAMNHAIQMLTDAGYPPTGMVLNQVKAKSRTFLSPDSSTDYSMFRKYGENYG